MFPIAAMRGGSSRCLRAGVDALGYVVELADAGRIFHQKLAKLDQVDLLCPSRIAEIERIDQNGVDLVLDNGEQLQSRLVVAADGALSSVCDMLGLGRSEHDFDQVAVIANVSTDEAHQGRAFERFTPHGPVALLPMSEGRSSLVWCIRPDVQDEVMGWSDAEFLAEFAAGIWLAVGPLESNRCASCLPALVASVPTFDLAPGGGGWQCSANPAPDCRPRLQPWFT